MYRDEYLFLNDLSSSELSESDSPVFYTKLSI